MTATDAVDAAATPPPAESKSPPKPRRRWRWLRWLFWLSLLLVIALRLALALFLQPLANFGAGFAGLSVDWRSSSLSLLGLSLQVEDLVVGIANDDGEPLLTAQSLTADLSMRQLLGGQVSVVDVAVAGGRVKLEQQADGTLRLPPAWLEPSAAEPEPEPEPNDDPLSFQLPVRIASARVHDLQIEFVDATAEPAQQYHATLDLDVADLGYDDRTGSVLLRVHAPEYLDEFWLRADGATTDKTASLHWRTALHGVQPSKLQLLSADVRQTIDEIMRGATNVDLDLGGELKAEVMAGSKLPWLLAELDARVALDEVERTVIRAALGTPEPTVPNADRIEFPFELDWHCDEVIDSLQLANGNFVMSGEQMDIEADVEAVGTTLERIEPLLQAAGLTLPEDGLDLSAKVQAHLGASVSAELQQFSIRSHEGEPIVLQEVRLRELATEGDVLAIAELAMVGPELPLQREADGSLLVAGLRFKPPPPPTGIAAPAQPPTEPQSPDEAPAAAPALPKIRLDNLDWVGARLVFTDLQTEPATKLVVDELRVVADGITIGHEGPPGHVDISAQLPDIAGPITAKATIDNQAKQLRAEFELRAEHIVASALKPYLEPAGIEVELRDGTFALAGDTTIDQTEDGLRCAATIANLRLVDGDQTWLKWRRIEGRDLLVQAGGVDIGTWTITEPHLTLYRDSDQALHLLGLRMAAAPATATAPPATPTQPAASTAPAPAPEAPAAGEAPQSNPQPPLKHGELTLQNAAITWRGPDNRTWSFGIDASVGANDGTGAPLPLKLRGSIDGALESLTVDGQLHLAGEHTSVQAELAASGIRGQAFDHLLPPGMRCNLQDGDFAASVRARLEQQAPFATTANVAGLRLLDAGEELAAIDAVVVDAPQLEPNSVHVRTLRLDGLRVVVTQTDDALLVPGLALAAANAAAPPPQPAPPAPTTPDEAPAARPPSAPMQLPQLRLDQLQLECERFELRDRTSAGIDSKPVAVTATLGLDQPWVGDPTSLEPEPVRFTLQSSVDPLGLNVLAQLALSPFDISPTADLQLRLTGFDTTQLAAIAPATADQLIGEAKALGLQADVHTRLDLRRRDPSKLDFNRPFGAEFVLENFAISDAATDRTFASIAAVDVLARAIDPATGSVLLRLIDIDEPVLRATREADGLHALGFVLPDPPEAEAAPTEGEATQSQPDQPAAAAPAPAPSNSEFAIDRLRLLGLRIDYLDRTTEPPTRLPFVDTDAELMRFSTRAFAEARPLSYSLAIRGGDIELERRVIKSSAISGFISSAAAAVTFGDDEHTYEKRPLVDQIASNGELVLYPTPKGKVGLNIDGLEMTAFRGLAKQSGLDIADGVFDFHVDVDLLGYDGIDIGSQSVFTHLSLSEPPGGPISTYLRLPAPLDTVLFLLKNNENEQRLPVKLHVPPDGLSQAAVLELATESVVKIIADAVSSAGRRAATTVTGAFLGVDQLPDVDTTVAFAAGDPLPAQPPAVAGNRTPPDPSARALDAIAAALATDETLTVVLQHQLGAGDLEHAGELANPTDEVVAATVEQLLDQRRKLTAKREPVARDLVALYAAGQQQRAWHRQRELAAIDNELGGVEQTLAEALSIVGERNPRKAKRRTREAAHELAAARLDAVAAALLHRLPNLAPERIELRLGRNRPIDGLAGGGRVHASVRRRAAR